MTFHSKVELPETITRGMSPEQSPAEGDEPAGDGKVEENSEKEEMEVGSTEWQARGWGQGYKRNMKDCKVEKYICRRTA